ncbi:hypothetical protein A2872_00655 [Candidatus Gottesmanbacteria bacterium RIFCSPHIGHO2_01_FULL_42_12]|uniref:23S rRNA (Guanosine(2251)-2'-O)-methyltransferase RlmB n=1 Tax=Candidatus Gottesmanbacteria bacterium RIFCSPHIGHO2_01_FULL_42_12 TaxID=1798377 RepID=A0A1F5YZV5_9BACT|nr:MAG: hypothetical protein A2872_00655 [Candidatus Gottesmanbacteria bacterium RIFCSPHIGHO2_01_FULL_42_12]
MKAANQIILQGRNTVHDALKSDKIISKIVIADDVEYDDKIAEIESLAKTKGVPIAVISARKMSNIAQGISAVMEVVTRPSIESILKSKENPVILLLNHLDYEQNLGAIMRTAWAAGVDAIVCAPNGVHEVTPVVSKVSQGAAAYVPVIAQSLFQAIDVLKRNYIPVVGVEVGLGEVYYKQNLLGPVAFLLGGEAKGLSDPLMRHCDVIINIPINENLASLNVSIATAVILFEKQRQEAQT